MGVEHDVIPVAAEGMKKVFASVLSSPGAIVSFSRLTKTGFFRRNEVDKMKNKALLLRTVDEMSQLHFGHIDNYTIPSNNSKVYFFCKRQPPQDPNETLVFARELATIGMSLPRYIDAYNMDNSE
ncbi:hypothetical protein OS493_016289, partial [Desmophyllum pertusum]